MFGLTRDLANPLAAPVPEVNPGPTAGTYVAIDRVVGGARGTMSRQAGRRPDVAPAHRRRGSCSSCGTTAQNLVQDGGVPTGAVLLDQREKVMELGPFAQLQWSPQRAACCSARAPGTTGYDSAWPTTTWPTDDDSGERTMSAASGNIGGELGVRRPSGAVRQCLDRVRDPDDNRAGEPARRLRRIQPGPGAAARRELRGRRARPPAAQPDAIRWRCFSGGSPTRSSSSRKSAGRAFFRNEGKTHNDGAEVGLTYSPIAALTLQRCVHLGPVSVRGRRRSTATVCPGFPSISGASAFGRPWRRGSSSMPTRRSARRCRRRCEHDHHRLVGRRRDQSATRLGGQHRQSAARTVHRRQQPVGPAIYRFGDPERRRGTRHRAVSAPGDLLGRGDRVSDGVTGSV